MTGEIGAEQMIGSEFCFLFVAAGGAPQVEQSLAGCFGGQQDVGFQCGTPLRSVRKAYCIATGRVCKEIGLQFC